MEKVSLKPLNIKNKLAKTPNKGPAYSVKVKNSKGEDVVLADPRSTRALVALMNQHAVIGGAAAHWGGPAAYAEVMSAIHGIMFNDSKVAWNDKFNFINDAGHAENGVYAVRANYGFDNMSVKDLFGFRSIKSKLTGHGEAHLNPEGVFISNGPLGSGVPQAQGLSVADKLIQNDRVTLCVVSDGASMEGEAKEAYAAIPGLASKGKTNPFVMIISDNNTKLSGRISEDSYSLDGTFTSMDNLGWNILKEESGNDLQKVYLKVEEAIEAAKKNPEKPVCLVLKTVKGYGVKFTEEMPSGGHGYPLKAYDERLVDFITEIYGNESAPEEFVNMAKEVLASKPAAKESTASSVKKEKVQVGLSKAAIQAVKDGYPVFSVSCDVAGSTGIAGFQKECPDRFLDVGIAESNMISTAIGLSKQGLIPIVDTFAQFGITKGNLPLIMASLSEAPIIGLFSHAGFQDAADGASHQATTYISAIGSIPGVNIIQLSTSYDAEKYLYAAIKKTAEDREAGRHPESYIFILGRENFVQYINADEKYEWGKAQVLKEGSDVVIASAGPMVPKALAAAELLEKEGIKATVLNNVFINKFDEDQVANLVTKCGGRIVTVEDHQLVCGMGSILAQSLLLKGVQVKLASLGVNGKFGQSAYLADEIYDLYDLNAEGIAKAAKSLVK